MAAAGVHQFALWPPIDAEPDREVELVLVVHLEGPVQGGENAGGLAEIHTGKGLRGQRVQHRNRKQSRPDSVAADIQQIDRKMVLINPVIAARIVAKLLTG